jgi:hypothetical protein
MPLRSPETKGRETKREISASFYADGFTGINRKYEYRYNKDKRRILR